MFGVATLGCSSRVVERSSRSLLVIDSCVWGNGEHSMAGLSWKTLDTRCAVPWKAAKFRKGIHKHGHGSAGDLRVPVWCLHLL